LPPVLKTFQFNIFQSYILEFGVDVNGTPYMRVIANGGFVLETPKVVTNVTQANPAVVTSAAHGFVNGDWVFGNGFVGMTQLNSRTFVVAGATTNTFTLNGLFNNPINSIGFGAYVSGGTFARLFTNRQIPYALPDLQYLKVVQSADVMTLCCVNQATGTEYQPADLSRLAANNWNFVTTTFASAIGAPTSCVAVPSTTVANNGTGNAFNVPAAQYAFCVTAIDINGEESIASPIAYTPNGTNAVSSVDIAITAGSITVTWAATSGAVSYNVYKAPAAVWNTGPTPGNNPPQSVPIGSAFGFAGSAVGTQFVDNNVSPDFTVTPPLHLNPFSRGQIISGTVTANGTGYTQATVSASITTATGSNAIIIPIIVSGEVVGFIVENPGGGYLPGNALVISDSGGGTGATGFVTIGPQTGTYPGVPGYFQQRRIYSATLNNPDTMFLSQTGAFTNMDSSDPPIDSDAIVMTPWAQQVNTVQWTLPMPGGLIVATGLDAWQVAGTSGAGSPLTPASESAQPQESYGFSPRVPPIRAGYDILYVQELGYTVRDLQYNFFSNVYAGNDLSVLSNQLFEGFQIISWGWSRIPWKIVWAVRDDGKALSLTYDKEEQLAGWARHDTNGLFQSVAIASEPPVDVPYFVVKRFIPGSASVPIGQWAYYIERMDNRFWDGPEAPWCIDAGLALGQPAPNATLSVATAVGPGNITGGFVSNGGQGYTNPSGQIIDPAGTGTGGQIAFTQAAGVVNGFTIVAQGQNYSPSTFVIINDPTGAGANFVPFVSQNVLFNASAPVFGNTTAGDVIRIGGGQATVSAVNTPSQVLAAITVPIVKTIPNDPNKLPIPASSGNWTITTPVTVITNLNHLEGMQVTGLADGQVIPLTTVVNGTVTLGTAASSIKIGLPFVAQLQALHLEEASQGSIQGKRKVVKGVTVRLEASRGVQVGANQPVASTLDFQQEIPWSNMTDLPEVPNAGIPTAALPLFSGDKFMPIGDDWANWDGWQASPGMVAAQQLLPLPMNIAAFVPTFEVGDQNG